MIADMCEITESESLERRLESLAVENERLRDDAALYVGRIRRLAVERDRMRAACEAAREFLTDAVAYGLARQEKGRVLVLIRAALDGDAAPVEGVKTLTVGPEQYELGSAVASGFTIQGGPFVRREPYRLVRRLPDGNYLVEDPAAAGPEGERRSDGDA
jgi:predicted transcriptional regulator